MAANKTENSRLQFWSIIRVLVVEKYKPYEICKTIYDVYRKTCFSKKRMFTNVLNRRFPPTIRN